MFDFVANTPPETAFLFGLTTGALVADTVERVMKHRIRQAGGMD